MRISDWSSDVCSSDLRKGAGGAGAADRPHRQKSSPVDDASQHGGRDRIGGARKLGQIFRYVPSPKEGQAGEGDAPGVLQNFLESRDPLVLDYGDNLTVSPQGHLIVCEDKSGTHINHLKMKIGRAQV